MRNQPIIFLSAAEASGDSHASSLVTALRSRLPSARFIGAGGAKMAAAGCEILVDMTAQASMLGGPLLKLGYYYRNIRRLQQAVRRLRPDVVVPVDSPALNWHVAKAARRVGAPVMYYVAPQVWAWAPWRIGKLRRLTDHVACLLPFEQEYFRSRDVAATFVGHPLFDHLPPRPRQLPDLAAAWQSGKWRVALLPGSRPAEIRHHAQALAAVAQAVRGRWPQAQCTLTAPSDEAAELVAAAAGQGGCEIAVGRTAEVLGRSHFAVAASGTVTLEAAYYGVPMVIVYRVARVGYNLVGRWLIRTPHLSLVNILAGEKLVPELMPWHGDTQQLVDAALGAMSDVGALAETRRRLLAITEPLHSQPTSTSQRVADLVIELLERQGG